MGHFDNNGWGGQWGDNQIAGPAVTARPFEPNPMDRGAWNVLPGGAVASPRYPYPPKDGTDIIDGWPTPAQWAYGDAGGAIPYTDTNGAGGYVYRVYTDGNITIIGDPVKGAVNIPVAKGSSAYNAIAVEVGLKTKTLTTAAGTSTGIVPTKAGDKRKPPNPEVVAATIGGTALVFSSVANLFAPKKGGKQAAAPIPAMYPTEAPSSGIGLGTWAIIGGVLVLVLGGVVLAVGRK